jgi:hypothetical protein
MDGDFEHNSRKAAEDADKEGHEKDKCAVIDMFLAP